ncbi:HAD-IB family hydrolase [Pseudoxanthomonas kalamensis DSM 18571]|uniref:HAD-IB family phosphatase n=1 Tax=Pseudoxanthomonas kalamensis TaxID=289483 RepID=UPI0013910291|nr:HAD-IB family phosphatase [Pseudoxanthomonas kalamensis]KAF1709975.1 HAD-IB family hydrolase [Pseudoxanthomonas kalamensis DSM 18571]
MQLALFDFDHTLTDRDSYARFLRRVASPTQLARARWSIGPWLLGYRAGLISAQRLRARVTRIVFSDHDADEVCAHGLAYANDAIPGMLRPEPMQRLAWHQTQGHEVAVVSASLDLYLHPWCEQHSLNLICNRLEARSGKLTGRYAGRDIGRHKADEIRARYDLSRYDRIHAYGDSHEDLAMLELAHERWYAGKRIA